MKNEVSPEIEFEHEDFDFTTTEDELRVDERCQALLYSFFSGSSGARINTGTGFGSILQR